MSNVYEVIKKSGEIVTVSIMFSRHSNKYHFVNLTKGHICACAFDSIDDAIADMDKQMKDGKIEQYYKQYWFESGFISD